MKKIAVGIIIKDDSELNILKRAVASVYDHIHAVFITATNTPNNLIKEYCKSDPKFHYSYYQWDNNFSNARNYNFSQITKEYDWIFWLDTDDIVEGAEHFQDAIKIAETNNIKAVFARYLYQVELDEKGRVKNILIEHLRERLLKNEDLFEWVAPIHETLIEKVPVGKTDYGGFLVIHLVDIKQMEKSMWRNITILEQNVIDNTQDPRPLYYLAKAYFDTKIPEVLYEPIGDGMESLVLEMLKVYRDMSGWAEERAQSLEYSSMVYREMNSFEKGIECLLAALKEDPKFTSIYIQIALVYVMLKDWKKALHWIKLAGQVEIPKTTLVINPKDYKCMILEAPFHIYLNTGQLELCQKVAIELSTLLPTDLNKNGVKDLADLKHRNDMAHWIVKLANHLNQTGQIKSLQSLVMSIPREVANEPVMVDLRNSFTEPRVWDMDEVAIYCGPGFEQWSWKNVSTGIGGSEEAVIHMAEELVKQGWRVTVLGDPGDAVGMHNGVNWLPYYHANWKDTFNVLVAWRQIGLFDIPGLRAMRTYLWNHDIQNPMTYTPERVNKITKVFFLSKWHRDNVPTLDESKVMITGNGI